MAIILGAANFLVSPKVPRGVRRIRRLPKGKLICWGNSFFGMRMVVKQSCDFLGSKLDLSVVKKRQLIAGNLTEAGRDSDALKHIFLHMFSVHCILVESFHFSYVSEALIAAVNANGRMFYTDDHLNNLIASGEDM